VSLIYGPVPSWRLGRSLGIDASPPQAKPVLSTVFTANWGTPVIR